jgi:hypothetical protein
VSWQQQVSKRSSFTSTAKAEEPPPENTMIAVATRKGVTLNEVNDKTGAGTEGGTGTGGQGNDTQQGAGGAETQEGGAGSDTQAGAAGSDTQPGAGGGDDDGLTERERMMNSIEQHNIAEIDKEHIAKGMPAPAATPAPTQAPKAAGDDQVELQTGADDVLEVDQLARMRVKVKIDGQEQEVTGADLVRNFQKAGAADKRLEEATRLLKEVKQTVAAPTASGPATPAPPAPPVGADGKKGGADSPASPSPDAGIEKSGKEFLAALFEGDETKAWDALRTVLQGRPSGEKTTTESSIPSEEQLLAKLTPAVKQQLAVESALDGFAKAHKDIVNDPHLAQLADGFLIEVQREQPDKPFGDQLEAAAERVQGWLKDKGVVAAPPPASGSTTTRTEKLEAKRVADQVAGASTRAATPVQQDPTPSETIADMRKARGMDA